MNPAIRGIIPKTIVAENVLKRAAIQHAKAEAKSIPKRLDVEKMAKTVENSQIVEKFQEFVRTRAEGSPKSFKGELQRYSNDLKWLDEELAKIHETPAKEELIALKQILVGEIKTFMTNEGMSSYIEGDLEVASVPFVPSSSLPPPTEKELEQLISKLVDARVDARIEERDKIKEKSPKDIKLAELKSNINATKEMLERVDYSTLKGKGLDDFNFLYSTLQKSMKELEKYEKTGKFNYTFSNALKKVADERKEKWNPTTEAGKNNYVALAVVVGLVYVSDCIYEMSLDASTENIDALSNKANSLNNDIKELRQTENLSLDQEKKLNKLESELAKVNEQIKLYQTGHTSISTDEKVTVGLKLRKAVRKEDLEQEALQKNPEQNFKENPVKDDDILAKTAKVFKFEKPLSAAFGYRPAHENIDKKLETLTTHFESIKGDVGREKRNQLGQE